MAETIEDVLAVVESGRSFDLTDTPGPRHDLLDHSLQTAEVLRRTQPDDVEMQIAGLVHDIGHVLAPYGDEVHGDVAADFVRPVLGDRVAELVRLHVPAKRYLVTTDADYRRGLAQDSVVSLARQGGDMTSAEVQVFAGLARADEALVLRRADEAGKVRGREVPGLDSWVAPLRSHNWAT
ncbi:MAG: inositol oxygenase family protein [Acidimicrobiales bacterium]